MRQCAYSNDVNRPGRESGQSSRKVRIFDTFGLGCGTVVVVQHPAKALTPPDCSYVLEVARFWKNEAVAKALMVAFMVIMRHELVHRSAQ
jgi:hypothetical protein